MKVLITGGAGFIGRALVRELPADAEIVIVDTLDDQVHDKQVEQGNFPETLSDRATCIRADVREVEKYREAAANADAVVHLAAQTGTGQSMYEISRYVQHNADGTARLLEWIAQMTAPPRRIVLASSRAVYGEGTYVSKSQNAQKQNAQPKRRLEDLQQGRWEVQDENGGVLQSLPMQEEQALHPVSVYGWTKLWQEDLVRHIAETHGIACTILRLQNVYGPEQALHNPYTGIIGLFTDAVVSKGRVELFEDGLMTRDFVFVSDVARAIARSLTVIESIEGVFNIGSGEATTLAGLVELLSRVCEKPVHFEYSGRFRQGDIRHAVADISRAREKFAPWQTVSLEDGLRRYVQWYREYSALQQKGDALQNSLQNSLQEMQQRGLIHAAHAEKN